MNRVGLVGCGQWGQHILRDLLTLGVGVSVVCRSETSNQHALSLGASSATSSIDDLAGTDGIVVATPTTSHASVIESILPFGKPIFVEKPLTADVASARRLVTAAGKRIFVMDKWRYHPGIEAMRQEIESGRAGKVLAVRLTRWGWGNPHADINGLWILAPHDLSMAIHLIGRLPEVAQAWAADPSQPDLAITAVLRDAEGPDVTLDISIASPEHRRRCAVVGSRMTLELRDAYDDRLYICEGGPGEPGAAEREIEVGSAMPLLLELRQFVEFLGGGPAPHSSAAEGLLVVERIARIEELLRIPS